MSIQDQIVAALTELANTLERDRAVQQAILAETQNANRLRGERPVPAGAGGRILLWAGPGRLVGWSLANTGEAPVTVTLRDSRDTTGDPIAVVTIPAGASKELSIAGGISFGDGLFADANDAFTGVVWIGAGS